MKMIKFEEMKSLSFGHWILYIHKVYNSVRKPNNEAKQAVL